MIVFSIPILQMKILSVKLINLPKRHNAIVEIQSDLFKSKSLTIRMGFKSLVIISQVTKAKC